jgi:hypothetical protein
MVVQSGSSHGAQLLPPHDSPAGHAPQLTVPPQPSDPLPQVLPWHGAAAGTQHAFVTHLSPAAQVSGHARAPPQPSEAVPQGTPAHASGAVFGVQHALSVQSTPVPHVPHETACPQASVTVPHVAWSV